MSREGALKNQVDILALGAACIVPALVVLWKAATLRKEIFDKWAVRVDIVSAGLSEHAARVLRELRDATDKLLGDSTKRFNPDVAVADPASLQQLTRQFDRCLGARRKLKKRFKVMMRLGSVTPYLCVAYLLGAGTALTFYAGLHAHRWFGIAGLLLAGVAMASGAVVTAWYAYLTARLTSAEMLAYQPSDLSSGGTGDD